MKIENTKQRSATISEFRHSANNEEAEDVKKNKLVLSQPYKISRSNSIHVYQEYGKRVGKSPLSDQDNRFDTTNFKIIPNTIDDDNTQTPSSYLSNDHDSNRNVSNKTVIIRKKDTDYSDQDLQESAVSNTELSERSNDIISSSSIPYPLLNNIDKFEESTMEDDQDSYTSPVPKAFTNKKIIIYFLIAIIVILLFTLVPLTVILINGAAFSIDNYFSKSNHLAQLQDLQMKYLPNNNFVAQNVLTNDLFYGISYGPKNSLEPNCGFNKRDAMLDLAKLSTITTRIRLYGMQCNQVEILLDSIVYMNLDMKVSLGVWIGPDDRSNRNQIDIMERVITKYPTSRLINSIYVGNEVLFRNDKTKSELINYIHEVRDFLHSIRVYDIPVGTADIGSLIDEDLLRNCDFVGANIHPFFGGVPVEEGAQWTLNFLDHQIQPRNRNINTPIVISEVGWPSGGGSFHNSLATFANSRFFINDFLCRSRNRALEYYYFEAFDEPWKQLYWEPNQRWETQWGIFNEDRSNKFSLQNIGCT